MPEEVSDRRSTGCVECGSLYNTALEAKACAFRHSSGGGLPDVSAIVNKAGHDGPHGPLLYTLEEARFELARRECLRSGHSFDVVYTVIDVPLCITCSNCGDSYQVVRSGM